MTVNNETKESGGGGRTQYGKLKMVFGLPSQVRRGLNRVEDSTVLVFSVPATVPEDPTLDRQVRQSHGRRDPTSIKSHVGIGGYPCSEGLTLSRGRYGWDRGTELIHKQLTYLLTYL